MSQPSEENVTGIAGGTVDDVCAAGLVEGGVLNKGTHQHADEINTSTVTRSEDTVSAGSVRGGNIVIGNGGSASLNVPDTSAATGQQPDKRTSPQVPVETRKRNTLGMKDGEAKTITTAGRAIGGMRNEGSHQHARTINSSSITDSLRCVSLGNVDGANVSIGPSQNNTSKEYSQAVTGGFDKDCRQWSVDDVGRFLSDKGLSEETVRSFKKNKISGEYILNIDDDWLTQLNIENKLDRMKLKIVIGNLKAANKA